MKGFSLAVFLCATTALSAQKNIDGMVNTEKSFAAFAVDHGTRDAFLHFIDSTGIMFDAGKPVNGLAYWQKRETRKGILNWWPEYAEIARSNDLGYTTGPWTFRQNTVTDSILARGRFITVWHRNDKGEWKFLVDLGVNNVPFTGDSNTKKIDMRVLGYKVGNQKSLLKCEEDFMMKTGSQESRLKAYKENLGSEFLLNRNNNNPVTTTDSLGTLVGSMPAEVNYTINGSGISSTGDLGYVFGSTLINGKSENYLRIWRREGKHWKITLEVLRY
jgi:ketosteroid isomerase-like protein